MGLHEHSPNKITRWRDEQIAQLCCLLNDIDRYVQPADERIFNKKWKCAPDQLERLGVRLTAWGDNVAATLENLFPEGADHAVIAGQDAFRANLIGLPRDNAAKLQAACLNGMQCRALEVSSCSLSIAEKLAYVDNARGASKSQLEKESNRMLAMVLAGESSKGMRR